MEKILISSCLIGEAVRYNGGHCFVKSPIIQQWLREGRLVPICPEVAGGLPVPRPPAEVVGGDGEAVLEGRAIVHTREGQTVTAQYVLGAQKALDLARWHNIRIAILKENSPACGTHWVYDGTFSGSKRKGMGVTAALLKRHGIRVFNENELEAVVAYLQKLEMEP